MRVIVQKWLESERGWGTRPDGYSVHPSLEALKRYVAAYNAAQPDEVPDEYSRPDGEPYEADWNRPPVWGDGQRFYDRLPKERAVDEPPSQKVEVPRSRLESVLTGAGFRRVKRLGPVAFEKVVSNKPRTKVVVETGVLYADDTALHPIGVEAHRVLPGDKNHVEKRAVLGRWRVNLVGSTDEVLGRVLDRCLQAHTAISRHLRREAQS